MPSYYLTLFEIKQYYYPKHISVKEIDKQSIGTTITLNDEDQVYILDKEYNYKNKPFSNK